MGNDVRVTIFCILLYLITVYMKHGFGEIPKEQRSNAVVFAIIGIRRLLDCFGTSYIACLLIIIPLVVLGVILVYDNFWWWSLLFLGLLHPIYDCVETGKILVCVVTLSGLIGVAFVATFLTNLLRGEQNV